MNFNKKCEKIAEEIKIKLLKRKSKVLDSSLYLGKKYVFIINSMKSKNVAINNNKYILKLLSRGLISVGTFFTYIKDESTDKDVEDTDTSFKLSFYFSFSIGLFCFSDKKLFSLVYKMNPAIDSLKNISNMNNKEESNFNP